MPVFVSFTVNVILNILTIFLFKILCWQCRKTAAVYQRMRMLDRWDKDNELLRWNLSWWKQVQPLLPLPVVPLIAILVERFLEWYTEKDEKDPPVQRRRVDEWIQIWAPLTNSEERKAGLWEVSSVFLYLVLASINLGRWFFHSSGLKCRDQFFYKVVNCSIYKL